MVKQTQGQDKKSNSKSDRSFNEIVLSTYGEANCNIV